MAGGFRALVRRRRDGMVVFDLDVVHAGVVAEALEQTRAVLVDDPGAPDGVGDEGPGGPGPGGRGGSGEPDGFDAIVAGLGDVGDVGRVGDADEGEDAGRRRAAAEAARDDPVVRRLLPDAFMDDADASAEFRRLSGDTVRSQKLTAIDSVLVDLRALGERDGGVAVTPERAMAWLTALNDARLALGTLLAVGEDDDLHAELDAYEEQLGRALAGDEPAEQALRAYRIAVYDFLSALLEMVVRVIDR